MSRELTAKQLLWEVRSIIRTAASFTEEEFNSRDFASKLSKEIQRGSTNKISFSDLRHTTSPNNTPAFRCYAVLLNPKTNFRGSIGFPPEWDDRAWDKLEKDTLREIKDSLRGFEYEVSTWDMQEKERVEVQVFIFGRQ